MFEEAFDKRCVPRGCYVQLGWCTHYVYEAGGHQSAQSYGDYVAYVTFGLSSLLFFVAMTNSEEMRPRALDVSRRPRLWFPGALHWLSPTERIDTDWTPRVLTADEAIVSGLSLAIRLGVETLVDNFGNTVDPMLPIPPSFHEGLAWPDTTFGSTFQ